jgi:hypothetical protein
VTLAEFHDREIRPENLNRRHTLMQKLRDWLRRAA